MRLFSSLPFRAWLDAWGAQRGRLLLAVSVCLSLGLLTLVWSFTWQRLASEKALTRANAQVQQQNLTAIISENLAQVLDRGRLMAITAESWFDGQDSGAAARLSAMIAADRTFLRVALYDDQLRRVYASSTGRDSPELRGALAEFLRAPPIQGATRLGLAPLPLASEQAWQIPLMVPVLGPSDRPSGVLLVVLDLGYFLQLYHHIDIGRTGRIQVLRLDGQIVAEARQEGLVLQKPGAGNPYLQSVTQAQGAVEADLYRDGRHHLSSYQQPHQMPFRVVVSREMGDILAVHQATRERFLGVLSLVSALFLGATFWVTQGIRRQGRYATALAQALQTGRTTAEAINHPETEGMGATLVVPALIENRLWWISVGDSPLFLYRGGKLSQLNEDHSMAPQIDFMVKSGLMDAETGANHPDRNCLISVLMGARIPKIDCPTKPFEMKAGDIVVCASDGLQFLTNAQIEKVLGKYRKSRCYRQQVVGKPPHHPCQLRRRRSATHQTS